MRVPDKHCQWRRMPQRILRSSAWLLSSLRSPFIARMSAADPSLHLGHDPLRKFGTERAAGQHVPIIAIRIRLLEALLPRHCSSELIRVLPWPVIAIVEEVNADAACNPRRRTLD